MKKIAFMLASGLLAAQISAAPQAWAADQVGS